MPYSDEESSIVASGNYNQSMLRDKNYNSLSYHDELKQKIYQGLKYLIKQNYMAFTPNKSDIYKQLHCIDGSLLGIQKDEGELLGLRVGNAIIDTEQLFNIQYNKFGTPNPYHVAQLYSHINNAYINSILPSRHIYNYENGQFNTLKHSFQLALDNTFEQGFAKDVKENYLAELKKNIHDNFSSIPAIKKIINDIREESIVFSTRSEVQKIMLIIESILAQYQLSSFTHSQKELIVLDGRLQNEDIGKDLKILTNAKIKNINQMLISVQKTGRLNILLSKIHDLLKYDSFQSHTELHYIKKSYDKGDSLIFVLDENFKTICAIPDAGHGAYGIDCLLITATPNRKEFVFNLPQGVFTQKPRLSVADLLHQLGSVFHYAKTDLYIKNKGVLLTNVLSHAQVSLNKEQTKILAHTQTEYEKKNNLKI